MPDWDDMVLVGFVARTHGNRGEVILKSETDFPGGAVSRWRHAVRAARDGAGRDVRSHGGKVPAGQADTRIGGIQLDQRGRTAGGRRVEGAGERAGPLPDGTYYHHELIGCEVVTRQAKSIGRVADVQGDGEATRLVVRGARGEVLIPLAQEICEIDVAAKRIVVIRPRDCWR